MKYFIVLILFLVFLVLLAQESPAYDLKAPEPADTFKAVPLPEVKQPQTIDRYMSRPSGLASKYGFKKMPDTAYDDQQPFEGKGSNFIKWMTGIAAFIIFFILVGELFRKNNR